MRKIINPVRKIGKGSSSLHGLVYSRKNDIHRAFESSLERDFIETLEFDHYVDYFCEQPLEIEYTHNGVKHKYTPDFFVAFRKDLAASSKMKSIIFEIKYRDTLKQKWAEFKPKFKAAKKYAEERGWFFRILTERNIRTPFLSNIKFLIRYKDSKSVNTDAFDILYNTLSELKVTTPEELIICAARDKKMQAELIFALWYMIASGGIGCDLHKPLTMKSEIWER